MLQFSHAYYVNGVFSGVIVASVLPGHLLEGVANIYPERDNVVLMVLNVHGHDSKRVEELADRALYDAKAQGRNRVCVDG